MPVTTRSASLANQSLPLVCKSEAGDQIKQEPQTPVQTAKKRKFEDGDAPEQRCLKKVVVEGMDAFERLVKRAQKLKEKAKKQAAKGQATIENETDKNWKEVDSSETQSAAAVTWEARKAQSNFAKAKNKAQKLGDEALAKIYFELEKKAGSLPGELRPKKTAAKKTAAKKTAAKKATKTSITQPSPRKSRKTILKKDLPALPLPVPEQKEEFMRKKLKKAIAAIDDQDTKYTMELAKALASVPQEKKADVWRLFGEKVEIETKVSDLKQKTSDLERQLDTVKSKLGHMTKQ